jgi:hypothetical protein
LDKPTERSRRTRLQSDIQKEKASVRLWSLADHWNFVEDCGTVEIRTKHEILGLLITLFLVTECSEKDAMQNQKEVHHMPSQSKIITIDKIEDIEIEFTKADNEMLVIFDYDDVLLEPVDVALFTSNENISDKIVADLMKDQNISRDQVIIALSVLTRDMKTCLVHEKWPLLITILQSRGIKTVLLTSCGAGRQGVIEKVENIRRNHLLNVGIDFKKSWKDLKRMEFHDIPRKHYQWCNTHFCAFIDGMLFADGANKGIVLKAFLSKIPQYKFKKIIFIDDKLKNLKAVEKICAETGTQFIGIEYAYSRIKKHLPLNHERIKKQYQTLMLEKRWISDAEMENYAKSPYEKMMEIIDFGVVRSCTCHQPTEEQVFAAVRKSVSAKEIADEILAEYIDDFFEIHHKIYSVVGFVCQLEFARKAYAEKIDMNIILDCVNNNLFGSNAIAKVSEDMIRNTKASIREEILSTGCGSLWKDYAKYHFIRAKLLKEENSGISYKQLSFERYENYQRVIAKVYDYACDSHALNCKYHIARNFIKCGVDTKLICKIFGFTDNEFEDFVKPVN